LFIHVFVSSSSSSSTSCPPCKQYEFEACPSGTLRYANNCNTNYEDTNRGPDTTKNNVDEIICREVCLGRAVVNELKRIILSSDIYTINDEHWGSCSDMPPSDLNDGPSRRRRKEIEIKIGNEHIAYTSIEYVSLSEIQRLSPDPDGHTSLYYLIQDLKCFIASLIDLHFKIKPIPMT
jgi:protein mago nashi